jgi:hypothetical protein
MAGVGVADGKPEQLYRNSLPRTYHWHNCRDTVHTREQPRVTLHNTLSINRSINDCYIYHAIIFGEKIHCMHMLFEETTCIWARAGGGRNMRGNLDRILNILCAHIRQIMQPQLH